MVSLTARQRKEGRNGANAGRARISSPQRTLAEGDEDGGRTIDVLVYREGDVGLARVEGEAMQLRRRAHTRYGQVRRQAQLHGAPLLALHNEIRRVYESDAGRPRDFTGTNRDVTDSGRRPSFAARSTMKETCS